MSTHESFGRTPAHPGRIVAGALLMLVGIGWLLDEVADVDVPWGALLPVALMLVGAALLLTARSGVGRGLIPIGIVLTIVLGLGTVLPGVPVSGGVGERRVEPTTIARVEDEHELGIGSLRIDLSGVDFPEGAHSMDASVGIGELVISVPSDVAIMAHGEVGAGNFVFLDDERSGLGVEETFTEDDYENAERTLRIDASVGLGSIEVRRSG